MVNRSKAIGTGAETAVVNFARTYGFGGSEPGTGAGRHVLKGGADEGDVWLCPGVLLEVKGGAAAEDAGPEQITRWLAETEAERVNARFAVGILVRKRRGYGVKRAGDWWAHMTMQTLLQQLAPGPRWDVDLSAVQLQLTYRDALTLVRAAGYGDPLEVGADR